MTVKDNTYYIAHNAVDVFHTGHCITETRLDTGQPILEQFAAWELIQARYLELTGNELPDIEL